MTDLSLRNAHSSASRVQRCVAVGYGARVITCNLCGAQAEGDTPPLTWVTSFDHGKRRVFCEQCSRENLRSIESKLDSEWW